MRRELTREALHELMRELARSAPKGGPFRIYVVGGATAVFFGWRRSTIDADLYADRDEVFHDIQGIKERLQLNIEFARLEHFVPPLAGTADRHVFIDRIGAIDFYHYDPHAQLLSKVVRGFRQDLLDAEQFVVSGMVDPGEFRNRVMDIPESAYAAYPSLSCSAVRDAIEQFLARIGSDR